jgi:urease gamma subunit
MEISMNSGMDRRRRNKKLKIARNIAIALVPIIIIGLLIFRLGTDAKSMLSEANTLKTDLKAVMTGVKERDVESVQNATLKLDNTVRKLDRTLSSPVWKAVSHAPFAGKYVKSVNTLVSVAEDASDNILKPALDVMDEYPLEGLKVGDGFSVSTINAYLNLLEDIEPRIESMTTKMQTVKLPLGKTEMLSEYTQMLTKLTAAYKENGEYLPLFRAFLGDGSDKLYLLAAQNSAEIRASGGFPGSMGTIRIEDGVLTIDDFKTVYDMISVNPPTEAHITDTEYLLFSGSLDYARDACYIPDFERVGEIWALAYESKNDEHIDGVISLTPVIIQKVLAYTGAVTLSDGTELNGDNATQMLQKDLYYKYLSSNSSYKISNANDYVDSLFAETAKIVMGKLVDDFDINRIADYSKIFTDGGKDRTILMWMEDETAESYVKAAGCSGALNDDPSNPEAGVFFSGANGSKLGWFVSLDTQIGDVTVNDDGSRTYDVTVTVSNDITRDDMYRAGNYIIGNYNGQVESYLHLFAPAGGTISDFETSNSMTMNMDEYHGLEVAYNVEFMLARSNPVTVTYKVTTAPGVSTPLKISQTPTLQSYR